MMDRVDAKGWEPSENGARLEPGVCQVWWAHLGYERRVHGTLLDATERTRHKALRQPDDRARFVLACAMERLVLARHLGEEPERVPIDRTCPDCGRPHGKPRLRASGVRVDFSVSHSGDRVVLAVSLDGAVGVDVEMARKNLDAEGLASHSLHPLEMSDFAGASDAERVSAFLSYWTRKEAILKATGDGLRAPLKGIQLSPLSEPPRIVAWDRGDGWSERLRLYALHPGARHVASLAVLDHVPSRIQELDAHDLLLGHGEPREPFKANS